MTPSIDRGPIYLSGESSGKPISDEVGRAHYSYRFVEDGYRDALRHAGFDPISIANPEFYSRIVDLPRFSEKAAAPPLHISVRSTENLRLCRPLYNIEMFAWEFDVLRADEIHGDSPFEHQLRMLSIADEVWTLCSYSQKVLEAYGVSKVRVVPAPVRYARQVPLESGADRVDALSRLGGLNSRPLSVNTMLDLDDPANVSTLRPLKSNKALARAAETGSLFVSVLNPHDLRKNLESLLLGFHAVTGIHETAALIIKFNLPPEFRSAQAFYHILRGKFPYLTSIVNDRIVFVSEFIDDDELSALYSSASFYISSAFAEGQNLPLQEAMIQGCVAVSPIHTAMADYLDEADCVRVASERTKLWTHSVGANVARRPFEVDRPRIVDVARAVRRALGLPDETRRELARRGAARIESDYSVEAIGRRIVDIQDDIAAQWQMQGRAAV